MSETIRPEKRQALLDRMRQLGVKEEDLNETFIVGGGPGGQKINKANTCVRLRHEPSGLDVKVQHSRSREMNRFFARRLLCEKLEALRKKATSEACAEAARIRRQKKRRTRRQKIRIQRDKALRSELKQTRRTIRDPEQD